MSENVLRALVNAIAWPDTETRTALLDDIQAEFHPEAEQSEAERTDAAERERRDRIASLRQQIADAEAEDQRAGRTASSTSEAVTERNVVTGERPADAPQVTTPVTPFHPTRTTESQSGPRPSEGSQS